MHLWTIFSVFLHMSLPTDVCKTSHIHKEEKTEGDMKEVGDGDETFVTQETREQQISPPKAPQLTEQILY